MTKDTLSQIRERVEKASDGPWQNDPKVGWPVAFSCGRDEDGKDYQVFTGPIAASCIKNGGAKNDSEFIAHARQDIPALLAYVEKLERVAEAARKFHDNVHEQPPCQSVMGIPGYCDLAIALRGMEE